MFTTKKRLIIALLTSLVILAAAGVAWYAWDDARSDKTKTVDTDTVKQELPKNPTSSPEQEKPHTELFGDKVVVLINQSIFGPKEASIAKGSVIQWTNMEATPHQIVTDDGTTITAASSPALGQGQSFEFTFDTAGTFKYHCNLHSEMKGTITVK